MKLGFVSAILDQISYEEMMDIAEYIINDGAISISELNQVDTDLWRSAITRFGAPILTEGLQKLSKFILKVA